MKRRNKQKRERKALNYAEHVKITKANEIFAKDA